MLARCLGLIPSQSEVVSAMQPERLSFSASLVTQGNHRFYTLTIPSDVLARTCFVSTRDEDPKEGFQRLLDRKRALEIAAYIDHGLGTIPTSIILSAQEHAALEYIRKSKTIEFLDFEHAFLVLDGQHRVYGFAEAKASLRVPVVIYSGLSRTEESRLFIDINTKQRPVPNELLLDIKSLAEYENDEEERMRGLFDTFNTDVGGPLYGLLSPAKQESGRISRVTFNGAIKPLLQSLGSLTAAESHNAISAYLSAVADGFSRHKAMSSLTRPTAFKAIMRLFPDVAVRVKDRYGSDYTKDNFADVLAPAFNRTVSSKLVNPGNSVQALYEHLKRCLEAGFQL